MIADKIRTTTTIAYHGHNDELLAPLLLPGGDLLGRQRPHCRHRCGTHRDRSMISPTGSMDNCSATVLFNPRDASHDVPIRRHKDCAQRTRLHGHGERCTSTIAPYAERLVRPNDPTGVDRELRDRMGRRHGNIMEVVGDVVAQLPLMLDFQRR